MSTFTGKCAVFAGFGYCLDYYSDYNYWIMEEQPKTKRNLITALQSINIQCDDTWNDDIRSGIRGCTFQCTYFPNEDEQKYLNQCFIYLWAFGVF
jgi:hypothetical protein